MIAYCTGLAGTNNRLQLMLEVQGQQIDNKASGFFSLTEATWNMLGYCTLLAMSTDADGTRRCTVSAQGYFTVGLKRTPAKATLNLAVHPNGSETAEAYVNDYYSGTQLAATPILPIYHGGITLSS